MSKFRIEPAGTVITISGDLDALGGLSAPNTGKFFYHDPDGVARWHDEPQRRGGIARWPLLSDAVGVHPSQVAEARAHSQSIGVPTDFTSDGRAVLRTPGHRRKYCEAIGVYDRNGSYSDPRKRT